jgi:ABC-2 type transport system ATP-binding protein
MIEARNLVKRYGSTTAVNDLSFSIRPGMVTGFLGPNGAGKTTTMRMFLGLDAPTQGLDDRRRPQLPRPGTASTGSGPSCGRWPPRAAPCWSPAT